MKANIQQAFEAALSHGYTLMSQGDYSQAYTLFGRAHVIGQRWVLPHTRSHWAFMVWGWRRRDWRELAGQCLRLPVGIVGSLIGWLPMGNTGGTDVRPTQPMPVPEDIARLLDQDSENS